MGRIKKYHNNEDRISAKRKQWQSYYDRNKEAINKKRMEKYYEETRSDK
jgi:hypothetical protein